jgi:hypothetical protein
MRGGWRLLSVAVLCGAMMCPVAMLAARPKLPVPSTWQLDQLRSDFGGGPGAKSDIFTVTSDKPNDLSMQFVTVDAAGQTVKSSWSGPENGEMLPVEGLPGTTFGIDRKGNEKWVFADGSTLEGVLSVSKDKRTVLVRGTLTGKDGKTYQQVLMYGRMD